MTWQRGYGRGNAVQIVFITGYPDSIAEGYEVAAMHYLMKPVSYEKLCKVLDRAAANLEKTVKRLCVTYDRRTNFVPFSQILYVEAQRQWVQIHTLQNNPYLVSLSEYLDLPNDMYKGTLAVEKRDDIDYEIEFRDVSFRYPSADSWALRHVSMKFRIGDKLAIVRLWILLRRRRSMRTSTCWWRIRPLCLSATGCQAVGFVTLLPCSTMDN